MKLFSVCLKKYSVLSLQEEFPSTKVQDRFCDETISVVTPGDCFGKKRLAMTNIGCFRTDIIYK